MGSGSTTGETRRCHAVKALQFPRLKGMLANGTEAGMLLHFCPNNVLVEGGTKRASCPEGPKD